MKYSAEAFAVTIRDALAARDLIDTADLAQQLCGVAAQYKISDEIVIDYIKFRAEITEWSAASFAAWCVKYKEAAAALATGVTENHYYDV